MQVERMDGVNAAAEERGNCEERKRRKNSQEAKASDRQRQTHFCLCQQKEGFFIFFANWLIHFLKGLGLNMYVLARKK